MDAHKLDETPSTALSDAAENANAKAAKRSRVSGIDRALQVIDYLYETGSPAGAYAIAKAIKAPLSTVYVIIDDLVEKNMLARNADGNIWLGARLYHYGLAYARSLDFMGVATHEMHDLCRHAGETVQLCGRDGDHMLVLAMADGPSHFQVASRVGTRVPLNWTASGRLLVGHLPEAERVELFRRCARTSPTGRAEINPETLSQSAAAAFHDRLSIQVAESDYAVACIASPICDNRGECVATISIVLPEQKVLADENHYTEQVRVSAERIEKLMGWRNH
ncbi:MULTISPECIES: IclR family transcriptional regulator [Agrobacterium]|uniref:IclR family transcriptional regulator n=1 Tax=Agrobacterium salinitolerans TaxID=1183413 RepID=A0A9X3QZJ2_9HYPH|nr:MULTISPECIES: IclR family transcriptional regulator [Agrobacterium]MBA4774562.1 IclR family transcriptional regulator [Hyphomicrobiales bacterium]MCZ7852469.1 IclR family transcriptional regulator [Agrobacterium salinitolerans]MCZ7893002.1 IclR family transcriptional regulator [Agrobacterium salinitolerans]MCZ7938392.1 IclR family transcriptional regulator [Agrobacterium salinitolerans]MCZ7976119.1 IclR family transcriptional regulator [Agrobacterium salinitolerans]